MADQVGVVDALRIEQREYRVGQLIEAARLDRLARLAVTGQVERPHRPVRGEIGVIEQPVVEIAAEAVDQHGGRAAAFAELQEAHRPAADLRLLGLRRGFVGRRARHEIALEFGDRRIDVGIARVGGRDDAEQRADRQRLAFLRDLPAQRAVERAFDTDEILSVSTSSTSSPFVTRSPSAFSQPLTCPCSIDSPHLGIVIM